MLPYAEAMAGLEVKKIDKEQHIMKLVTRKLDFQCANIDVFNGMCPREQ